MSHHPFLWGAATAAHQVEGDNFHSDWWAWEHEGRVEGGVRSGKASGHRERFREDIKLAADLGLNSYRFSVEWARIEPNEGLWDLSALEWYRELISECERHGVMPMLTLHHFTSPQWFTAQGGFAWSEAPHRFRAYVLKVIQALGPRVPLWCTINEPMVLIAGGYLSNKMPPGLASTRSASIANLNLFRCHVDAYELIHSQVNERQGPWRDLPLQVGFAHNMVDFYPDRNWNPLDQMMAGVLHRFYNRAWLDAAAGVAQNFGVLGVIPNPGVVEKALGRPTVDFLGVNYYTKSYVKGRIPNPLDASSVPIELAFAKGAEPRSDVGWAIHPEGLGNVLTLAGRYQFPIYITENGIADDSDEQRQEYYRAHLMEVGRMSHGQGLDIRGYYCWSLIDNFEWDKGFWPRFGLYRVDYDTFERIPTKAAEFLKRTIRAHRELNAKGPIPELLQQLFLAPNSLALQQEFAFKFAKAK
jgi:beta-glucosidase